MIRRKRAGKYGKGILVFIRSALVHISLKPRNQTDLCQSEKSLVTGSRAYPSWILLPRRPVTDNNTCAAMLQTGEAHLLFLSLAMSRPRYWRKNKTRTGRQPVHYAALYQYECDAEAA